MSRRGRAVAVAVAVAGGAVCLWLAGGLGRAREAVPRATLPVSEALGAGDVAGFARALGPRPFSFPDDHGPHPAFRTEWWYYTANLETPSGRHVGVQLTFFRTALAPPDRVSASSAASAPGAPSAWRASQLYLAHFALTDTAGGRFHAASRLSREALGLAGATARPFRVWVEGWSAASAVAEGFPVRLEAADRDVAVDLTCEPAKPVVLQGDRGFSRKGPERGNASYYYSFTRMASRGRVRIGGEWLDVAGVAWMDREWSTSALGADLAGWDWLALQLDDGRDVMVYRLRRPDGSAAPESAGTLIAADGAAQPLAPGDVALEVLDRWTSPATGVRYPARWRLTAPRAGLDVEIRPRLADQELVVGTRYWEGAVTVAGTAAGRPVAGRGYVELVGYGE